MEPQIGFGWIRIENEKEDEEEKTTMMQLG